MEGLTIAPLEKKTIEINGSVYEIQVTDLEVIEMIIDFDAKLKDIIKKADSKKGELNFKDAKDAVGFYKACARGVDRMLGEGALEKIMGTASLPTAKIVEVFEAVSGGISRVYETDIRKIYE